MTSHSTLTLSVAPTCADENAGWQRDAGSVMDPLVKIHNTLRDSRGYLHQMWTHFFTIATVGTGILGHPDYDPPMGRSKVIYQNPLFDCGTAAYEDVKAILKRIYDFHVGLLKQLVVLVVGDQQTFIRMLKLKIQNPRLYRWLVPIPGEFHFKWHAALALHRLWWTVMCKWFQQAAEQTNTVTEKGMEAADKIKYILPFCSLVILAIATYLKNVFGEDLDDVDAFLAAHVANTGVPQFRRERTLKIRIARNLQRAQFIH